MLTKKFRRQIEDFVCGHCGQRVKGNGYTNHCPDCLWSRHVDVNPGDRAAKCGGLMEPLEIYQKHGEFYILHLCQKCGRKKTNRAKKNDNLDQIIKISSGMI